MITECILNGTPMLIAIPNYFFLLELSIAQLIFLSTVQKRRKFVLRITILLAIVILFCLFVPNIVYSPWSAFGYFTILFCVSIFAMSCCFKAKLKELLFCCSAGYCVQNIIVNISSLSSYLNFSEKIADIIYLVIRLVIAFVGYFVTYRVLRKKFGGMISIKYSLKQMVVFVFLTIFFANFMNCFSFIATTDVMYGIVGRSAIIFCDFFIVYVQFMLFAKNSLAEELHLINEILKKDKLLFEQSQTNVTALNMYLHDMKYWFMEHNDNQVSKAEIKKVMDEYAMNVKTGNDALDVVLYEINSKCYLNGILLTTVVDGQSLNFMKKNDIYTLFGNILDNAIEAVSKIEGDRNKTISFSVTQQNEKINIRVENYYEGDIVFKDNFPVTSKENKKMHGLGLKSVSYIVQKYKGELCIEPSDEIFTLNIAIPCS